MKTELSIRLDSAMQSLTGELTTLTHNYRERSSPPDAPVKRLIKMFKRGTNMIRLSQRFALCEHGQRRNIDRIIVPQLGRSQRRRFCGATIYD